MAALREMSKSWVFAEELSHAKVATLRSLFCLMAGQRRCQQEAVLSNFRCAIFDYKGAESLTEAVALEAIRKMKVVYAF